MKKKWTVEEMAAHSFEVGYYGGYYVNLNIPDGLTERQHYEYASQKIKFINGLAKLAKRKAGYLRKANK